MVTKVNPLENIRGLEDAKNITLVMKGGQVVKNLLEAPAPATAV